MAKKEEHDSIIRKLFILIFFLILGVLLYSHFIGTKGLVVREYSIINNKLTDSYHGLKIIHFTDLHFGTTVDTNELENIINEMNKLEPEIIVFTGDLIDKNIDISKDQLTELINTLKKLNPGITSYIVKGNHDHNDNYDYVLKNTNLKLLNNQSELFYYNDNIPILIIGLEDYLEGNQDIFKAFENYNEEYYTILLIHEPDTVKKITDYTPDLILAGHSHNGQIRLPFIGALYKVEGAKEYYDEKYLINNTPMYISGGLGTSKYPFRLFNRPSFNFYRLYNK